MHSYTYLCNGESISFGNDRNEIDFILKSFEKFQINLPQAMAVGRDEIKTGVNSGIHNILPI